MSKGTGPRINSLRGRGFRNAAVGTALAATCAGAALAETRTVTSSGYVLVVGGGRTAVATGTGFLVGLPDNDRRREPVEIDVSVVAQPVPSGLTRCSLWRAWPLCRWSQGAAGGSMGEPVTLEMYEPLDDKLIRYRQTKHADGVRPVFEAIEWRLSGDLRVERRPD